MEKVTDDDIMRVAMKYVMDRDDTWVAPVRAVKRRAEAAAALGRNLAFELRALRETHFRRPRADAYESFELGVRHVLDCSVLETVWPSYTPEFRTLAPKDLLEIAQRRRSDDIERAAVLCRLLAATAEQLLGYHEESRKKSDGRGAPPNAALEELVTWLIEHRIGAHRAGRVFAEAEFRNKPGGRVLDAAAWRERLSKAIKRHRGRNVRTT